MRLAEWPVPERPREKMAKMGAQALGDAELVSLLLGTGRIGENVFDVSMEMLNRFGGLQGIDAATVRELTLIPGIGPSKAAMLKAAMELGRRTIAERSSRCIIRSSLDLFHSLEAGFHGLDREVFYSVFLDSGLRLREKLVVSTGVTSACLLDTRLLLRDALSKGACSVALAHNHPSGECRPSAEDARLTEKICTSLETVGLRLLDHLIICGNQYYSFADAGLIKSPAAKGSRPEGSLQASCPRVPWFPCRP